MKAPYILIGFLVLIEVCLTALDWRAGLTLALICLYFSFLTFRLESGIYIILAATVIFAEGWAPERSPEDVVFRLGLGRVYIMGIAAYGRLLMYSRKRSFGSMWPEAQRLTEDVVIPRRRRREGDSQNIKVFQR